MTNHQSDMFGQAPPEQGNLFGEGENRMQTPARPPIDLTALARKEMNTLLRMAKAAKKSPWPDDVGRSYRLVFGKMGERLPPEEAAPMIAEFIAELDRLGVPLRTPYYDLENALARIQQR